MLEAKLESFLCENLVLEESFSSVSKYEQIERKIEGDFLKEGQVAFDIDENGRIITPFHSSITHLMKSRGLRLTNVDRDQLCITERYETKKGKQRYYLDIGYEMHPFSYEITVKPENVSVKFDRETFVVVPKAVEIPYYSPFDESLRRSVDLTNLIRKHPNNKYRIAIAKLAFAVIESRRKISFYII